MATLTGTTLHSHSHHELDTTDPRRVDMRREETGIEGAPESVSRLTPVPGEKRETTTAAVPGGTSLQANTFVHAIGTKNLCPKGLR
jgi:hypothetical protein